MQEVSRAMPAKRYTYTVLATRYATLQDRDWLLSGSVPTYQAEVVYMGSSERIASWHFTRACRVQQHNELAYSVTLKRGYEVLAEVKPL